MTEGFHLEATRQTCRRWFPWRVRSRVGVAEGVWREGGVCACEREVCLGCVRVLLFCV